VDLHLFEGEEIMFYGQCNDCGQRWELGTARTCICEAAPVQEPVAWRWKNNGEDKWLNEYTYLDRGGPDCPEECEPLYTTPPAAQRQWVGLTDEEISACDPQEEFWGLHEVVRRAEAKLKQKNTGLKLK
jgi:hypothetical protein